MYNYYTYMQCTCASIYIHVRIVCIHAFMYMYTLGEAIGHTEYTEDMLSPIRTCSLGTKCINDWYYFPE